MLLDVNTVKCSQLLQSCVSRAPVDRLGLSAFKHTSTCTASLDDFKDSIELGLCERKASKIRTVIKIKVEPAVSSLLQDCPKGVFNNSLIYSDTVTKRLQNIAYFQVKTVTISIFHYVTWKTTKSDLANFTDFGSFGAITLTAATSSSWKLLQIKTDCVLVRHHSMHHHKASYPHTSLNKYHFYCCLLHCTNIF